MADAKQLLSQLGVQPVEWAAACLAAAFAHSWHEATQGGLSHLTPGASELRRHTRHIGAALRRNGLINAAMAISNGDVVVPMLCFAQSGMAQAEALLPALSHFARWLAEMLCELSDPAANNAVSGLMCLMRTAFAAVHSDTSAAVQLEDAELAHSFSAIVHFAATAARTQLQAGNSSGTRAWVDLMTDILTVHVELPAEFNSFSSRRRGFSAPECSTAALDAMRALLAMLPGVGQQPDFDEAAVDGSEIPWMAAHTFFTLGDATMLSAIMALPASTVQGFLSSILAAAASMSLARATTPPAIALQMFCIGCIAADIITQVAHERKASIWPPDWAVQYAVTFGHCSCLLQRNQQLLATAVQHTMQPCTQQPELKSVGFMAYQTAIEMAINAVSCCEVGCPLDHRGRAALLTAFSSFLSCPVQVFQAYTLDPAASASELQGAEANQALSSASVCSTDLALIIITGESQNVQQRLLMQQKAVQQQETAPQQEAMQAVRKLLAALLQTATLMHLLAARLAQLCIQEHGRMILKEDLRLRAISWVLSVVQAANAAGSAWHGMLHAAECHAALQQCLWTATEVTRNTSQQSRAVLAFQQTCATIAELLNCEAARSHYGTLGEWLRSTVAMRTELQRQRPFAVVQRCQHALAKVDAMLSTAAGSTAMAGLRTTADEQAAADAAMQALLSEEEAAAAIASRRLPARSPKQRSTASTSPAGPAALTSHSGSGTAGGSTAVSAMSRKPLICPLTALGTGDQLLLSCCAMRANLLRRCKGVSCSGLLCS